jgi:pyruvate carboxylase subunit B
MADLSLLKAIEAGVDVVDTCLSPWAFRSSHPAIEPLVVALQGTNRDTGFDLKQLAKLSVFVESVSPKYRHLLDDRMSVIDINVLLHQTPGGMLSNLINQLREMGASDKLDDVFRALPQVRKKMGQVPLVTPTSQIVGIQAVNNVLFDTPEESFKMISAQSKDLFFGLYGETPVPVDPETQKKALKGYPRGEVPITCRPADEIAPELDKCWKETEGLAKDIDDVLIYAIYPMTGKRYLNWKYGKEPVPAEVIAKTLEQVKAEDELIAKAKKGLLIEKPTKQAPPKGEAIRTFNVFVDGEYFEVEVDMVGGAPAIASIAPVAAPVARPAAAPAPKPAAAAAPAPAAAPKAAPVEGGTVLESPMPGMVIRYEVKVGDKVEAGDVVMILEAMKMENSLPAPVAGTVKSINCKEGQSVQKGDVLAVIG